jgi:hypothetical protein
MLTKSITLDLPVGLSDAIDEAAASDALPTKDWLEQTLIKIVAARKHPGYSTDLHRVIRVFLRDVDTKTNRSAADMASEACVPPAIFCDILRTRGVKIGADMSITITPDAIDHLRYALQKTGAS